MNKAVVPHWQASFDYLLPKVGYADNCHDGRLYEKLKINKSWIYLITNLRKLVRSLQLWTFYQLPFNKPYKTDSTPERRKVPHEPRGLPTFACLFLYPPKLDGCEENTVYQVETENFI